MEQLNTIIKNYLLADKTDYAIMINGVWGCGKSYYLDHGFKEVVEKIDAPKDIIYKAKKWFAKDDDQPKYQMAYISLYGLSSAEDFYHRVFCGINSWAQNGFVGFVGTGVTKVAEVFGISTDKKDAKVITYIRTNQVLVFDDLERISDDKITIKEVLGLINKYAEHDKRKVVIVCNENHFLGDEADDDIKADYRRYKEKSIRFTYTYEANISDVYDAMVSTLPIGDYRSCLVDNKGDFLHVFKIGDGKNLRTLKFFVDTFEQLYAVVKNEKYKKELVKRLATTLLMYSLEYKSGKTVDDLMGLDASKYQIDTSYWGAGRQEESESKETYYPNEFRKRYSELMTSFAPCDAIVSYVANGYLEIRELKKTISIINTELARQELTPEGIVYRKLNSMHTIDDDEIEPCVREMMSYVEEDKYNIYDLLYVYALLLKYNHIGSIELTDKMTQSIKDAIERRKDNHQYNSSFTMKTPIWDDAERGTESYALYNEMKRIAEDINYQAKVKSEQSKVELFMEFAEKDDIDSLRKMRDESEPLRLTGIDWTRICTVLEHGSNAVANELCNSLSTYIRRGSLYPDDEDKMRAELLTWIDNYLAKDDKRVRALRIKELKKQIEEI